MTAFATIADLSAYLGRDIPSGDATAALALDLASDVIRAYCGQNITAQDGVTFELEGSGTHLLLIPEQPLRAVTSVKIDGETLDAAGYSWTSWGGIIKSPGYVWTPDNGIVRNSKTWPGMTSRIEVVCDVGYESIPGAVKAATLSIASRIVDSPPAVRQETIGAYSVTYTNGAPTLLDSEIRNLEPYRIS